MGSRRREEQLQAKDRSVVKPVKIYVLPIVNFLSFGDSISNVIFYLIRVSINLIRSFQILSSSLFDRRRPES